MAVGIINMPNTSPPDSDYPSGRIKDNPGDGTGTPVNQLTNGDIQEFFAKLLRLAGVAPSGNPENEYSGHQYIDALTAFGNSNFSQDIILGLLAGNYTANNLIILWGCSITPTIPGTSTITAGAIYYNGRIYKVYAGSIVTTGSQTLVFEIINGDPDFIQLQAGNSGSGIADYNSNEVFPLIYQGAYNGLACVVSINDLFGDKTLTNQNLIASRNGSLIRITGSLYYTCNGTGTDFAITITFNHPYLLKTGSGALGKIQGTCEIWKNGAVRYPLEVGSNIDVSGSAALEIGLGVALISYVNTDTLQIKIDLTIPAF